MVLRLASLLRLVEKESKRKITFFCLEDWSKRKARGQSQLLLLLLLLLLCSTFFLRRGKGDSFPSSTRGTLPKPSCVELAPQALAAESELAQGRSPRPVAWMTMPTWVWLKFQDLTQHLFGVSIYQGTIWGFHILSHIHLGLQPTSGK